VSDSYRQSGDGFMRCSDGHVRWGIFGAAGVVFVCDSEEGRLAMVQRRSAFAHEGGTWSCAGGALDEGESPLAGGLREASEEVGLVPQQIEVLGEVVFAPAIDWAYTTFVVHVPEPFGASINFETDDVAWLPLDDVDRLPLHAGFAAAWPELKEIAAQAQ
jgi:8-oxo-dGTP diphosphatase